MWVDRNHFLAIASQMVRVPVDRLNVGLISHLSRVHELLKDSMENYFPATFGHVGPYMAGYIAAWMAANPGESFEQSPPEKREKKIKRSPKIVEKVSGKTLILQDVT
jgi:hypothetical protein